MVFKLNDVNGNAADPLHKRGEESGQELFSRLSQACHQFPYDAVVVAAGNLLINAIRQNCKTQKEAEVAYDELSYVLKATLLDQHYVPSGARRNIFPYTQELRPDFFDARKKKN